MRSLLFVPGGRVEMLAKVGRVAPDTVVVPANPFWCASASSWSSVRSASEL